MAAGVFGQLLARHLRVPGIVVLLALGVAVGPEGLGWVRPGGLGSSLHAWVHFAVAVILFEGGMNLERERLRRMQLSLRRLLFVGGAITWLGAAAAAAILLHWPPSLALLFGSLVVVTGPTVVGPLLRELRFKREPRSFLEAEGVLIDSLGALLAAVMLQVALLPAARTVGLETAMVLARVLVGGLGGAAAGWLIARMLASPRFVPRGLENILALSMVVLLFHAAEAALAYTGIVAVTVAGIVVGNMQTRFDRDLREFKDQLTVLLIGFVFVLLAADVRLEDIRRLGQGAWMVVGALVLVVRPLSVLISTIGTGLPLRERLLASLLAPRGIVAAAVASSSAAALQKAGMEEADALRALVFLTIAVTVTLAGLIAAPLGSLLGLRLGPRRGVGILGANGLGIVLGQELRRAGRDVVFFDDEPRSCRRAEEAGFRVVFGDALRERALLLAGVEEMELTIGATPNDHLNTLFASACCEVHRVPRGIVALAGSGSAADFDRLRRFDGKVLFEGPHDRMRWDLRWRNGETMLLRLPCVVTPAMSRLADEAGTGAVVGAIQLREPWVMVGYERAGRFEPMLRSTELRTGDVVSVLIHAPVRDEALQRLASLGFGQPVPEGEGSST